MKYFLLLPRCVEFYFYLYFGTSVFLMQQPRRRLFLLRVGLSAVACVLIMNHFYYAILLHNHDMNNLGNTAIYVSALFFCAQSHTSASTSPGAKLAFAPWLVMARSSPIPSAPN